MDFKDYYQVLGVARDASADDIRKAYRRLARKYHPDVSKEPDAAERMSELNEANSVLSDPERRKAYDTLGNRHGAGDDFRPPPDWQDLHRAAGRSRASAGHGPFAGAAGQGPFGGAAGPADEADFSEFFSSMFGRRAAQEAGQGAGAGGASMRFDGADHHARIEVSVAEAYHGAARTLQLRDGLGETRTLEVRIPKGVRDGQMVRLAGQGMPGLNGGRAGDLFLEVHLLPAPDLRVDGRDVTQRLPVTPWEAALGATVRADTVAGPVEVRIPGNSQAGRKLRLRGKGLPAREPGDLYLELAVVLPPSDSPAARALYEQMARDLAFDPRVPQAGAAKESST